MTTTFAGVPAAPGVGIGTLYLYHAPDGNIDADLVVPTHSADHDPGAEWQQFLDAQDAVDAELAGASESLNSVAIDIFAVHQLILRDPTLTDAIKSAIYLSRYDAPTATYRAVREISSLFAEMDDEYFASRAADIRDIGRRLLRHLGVHLPADPLDELPDGAILVAQDLTPSDVTTLADARVVGIALAASTPTAHSSILARSLGLPLVCGLGDRILELDAGITAILDGMQGTLLIAPGTLEETHYVELLHAQERYRQLAYDHAHDPAVTRDGVRVAVYANANKPDDMEQIRHIGADGIGLLRTEYLFQNRTLPPSVVEQVEVFAGFGRKLSGKLLTVRALDAGGDKPVDFIHASLEENPFLGKRGIRLLLAHTDLLRDQYRALAIAARDQLPGVRIRFMLPMVSTLEEVEAARGIIDQAHREVFGGPQRREEIELGVLIEVPAAALIARHLAEMVDFFSIGTNDLAQYVMASDRTNSHVAQLADPLHPAVLFMIRHVCVGAMERELPVSLCGEMAGDVRAIPLLYGLGVSEFSAPVPAVPMVKQVLREWSTAECRELAELALRCNRVDRVRMLLTHVKPRVTE